jgi:hypothetical protein
VCDGAAAPGGHRALQSRLDERCGALAVAGLRAVRSRRCSASYVPYEAGGRPTAPAVGAAGCPGAERRSMVEHRPCWWRC